MEGPAIETVRSAMADNDPEGAIHGLAHLERNDLRALNPDECIRLATWLNDSGHTVAATRLLRLCLAGNPTGAHLARVYLMLGLIRLRQGQPAAAYQHLLDVFEHDPDARTAAEARQALAGIDVYRKS